MTLQVEICNFQAIAQSKLILSGFTSLVGRSNIGKSSVVRAIKYALTGATGTAFVRHGDSCLKKKKSGKNCKCFSSVHLVSEGFDLLWEKGDAINRYTFNGQIYDRAERGTPDFLTDLFSPVKVGTQSQMLQVSDQLKPIFLLDQTGGVIAEVLSDVANLDRINVAMKLVERDRRDLTSQRKVRDTDIKEVAASLGLYIGFDEVSGQVQSLSKDLVQLDQQGLSLVSLENYLSTLGVAERALEGLSFVEDLTCFDPQDLSRALASILLVLSYMGKARSRYQEVQSLGGVGDLSTVEPYGVQDAFVSHQRLSKWNLSLEKHRTLFESSKLLSQVTLEAFLPQEPLKCLNDLVGFSRRYETLNKELASMEDILLSLEVLQEKLQLEIDSLGVCMTCLKPLVEATCHV
jgi:hypothetical protein